MRWAASFNTWSPSPAHALFRGAPCRGGGCPTTPAEAPRRTSPQVTPTSGWPTAWAVFSPCSPPLTALHLLLGHLDTWVQDGPAGPWWPETLTLHDVAAGRPHHGGPARPSWCYGTPGLARAGQLAALALGDRPRQEFFEHALDRCLSDPVQLARINDAGLCHGWAGLYQSTWRAAADATSPALAAHLPRLRAALAANANPGTEDPGFLDGTAGTALALMTALTDTAPATGWDTCLLIA